MGNIVSVPGAAKLYMKSGQNSESNIVNTVRFTKSKSMVNISFTSGGEERSGVVRVRRAITLPSLIFTSVELG